MSKSATADGPRFWWCSDCEGAVTDRREECFCCGADRPEDAETFTREEAAVKARQREQVEEGLL